MKSYPILELRQYTLKPGHRDRLIELFEREFIEPQEALGMKIIGTFTDVDRPDRFVWLRGFTDMGARRDGLENFYSGPIWEAHREAANSTMLDSDNVLLLHAPTASAQFPVDGGRPAGAAIGRGGLVVAVIQYLTGRAGEAVATFERQVKPQLEAAAIPVTAWFVTETVPNNFPRHPVREGENVLTWFTHFVDEADYVSRVTELAQSTMPLGHWLARTPEVLRLRPTPRSLLRGAE